MADNAREQSTNIWNQDFIKYTVEGVICIVVITNRSGGNTWGRNWRCSLHTT